MVSRSIVFGQNPRSGHFRLAPSSSGLPITEPTLTAAYKLLFSGMVIYLRGFSAYGVAWIDSGPILPAHTTNMFSLIRLVIGTGFPLTPVGALKNQTKVDFQASVDGSLSWD